MPNFKRVALTFLFVLLCAGAVHGVHALQHGRNVAILKRQVERERDSDNPARLISALKRYLAAQPNDTERRIELVDLLADYARSQNEMLDVYYAYKELLRRRPDDVKQRERMIAYSLKIGEYQEVLRNIEFLAQKSPGDQSPQLLVWKATAQQKTGDMEGAIRSYRAAIDLDPSLIPAYVELASIHRTIDAMDESQYWMQRLIEANPESSDAFLAQAQFYFDHNEFASALKAVETAIALPGNRSEAVLLWSDIASAANSQETIRGEHTWQERDEETARRLEEAWEQDPGEARFASKLCALALRRQDAEDAERLLRLGLERSPDNPMLTWDLADLAISRGRIEEARRLISQLTAIKVEQGLIEYLRGRILMREQQWNQAASSLLRARSDVAASPGLSARADIFLAECYAELGDSDQRLNASRRAVEAQPFLVTARQHLAQALLAVGRIDEALAEYRTMIDLPDAPAFGWTADVGWAAVAKVLIIRNLSAPKGARNWDEINPVLDALVAAAPDSIEAVLLRAEVLAAQSQVEEARAVLQNYKTEEHRDARWWIALINLALRDNDLPEAERLLQVAKAEVGRNVDLKLTEARLALYQESGGEERLAAISADLEDWDVTDRTRLLYELAAMYRSLGRNDRAQKLWEEISVLKPNDLRVWLYLFDAAIDKQDFDACRKIIASMQNIEGKQGSYTQLAESFLVLRTAIKEDDRTKLESARITLLNLKTHRPRWARVPWALALLDEFEGRQKDAADNYLKAFDLGDRNPELVRRALNLMHSQHKYVEAEDLVKRWEQIPNAPILPEINRMAAEISLERQDPQQALLRAERAVSKNSVNYRDHLWLAHIHRAGGDAEEAELEFRTAVRLAPETGETWVALIRHLQLQGRTADAESLLGRIDVEVPQDQQPAVRAICLQALGKGADAVREYHRALELAPDDARLMTEAAEFFRGVGKLSESERLWRKLLELNVQGTRLDRCAARRGLAQTLAMRGDHPSFREALSLVELNLKELPNSTPDLRGKATLLAVRGDPRQRQESVQLFDRLGREEPLTEQDQALLAAMHELNGDLTKAHDDWQNLAATHPDNPVYLARYIGIQLKRQASADARLWLEQLQKTAPDWPTTLELQAEFWLRDGRVQDVIDLYEQHVQKENEEAARARRKIEAAVAEERLANSFLRQKETQRVQLLKAAENLFRDYVRSNPDKPQVLAGFLARNGHDLEALDLFDRAWEVASAELVSSVMTASLSRAEPRPEILARASESINSHLPNPPLPSMLNDLGMLAELQQHFDQAETRYREVLRLDPDNVVALNNLAFLLALQDRSVSEASQLIEKALALEGPSPALLDTRAQVSLATGDLEGARTDREAVVHEAPSAAAWFRLAIVYRELKDLRKMQNAAEKAEQGGILPGDVHFLERRNLEMILKSVDDKAA